MEHADTIVVVTPEAHKPETPPNVELLRALGRVVRGLSVLFWGLPLALILCVQAAKTDMLIHLAGFTPVLAGVLPLVPPFVATTWLCYGLWQLAYFQKQERIWISALDRARLLALVNVGLSPFLHWWNRRPEVAFFSISVEVLAATGLIFLANLNLVLYRLSAMLPDENLRQETRHFTTLNRLLVLGILLFSAGFLILSRRPDLMPALTSYLERNDSLWAVLFLSLLPLAITMALIWKIKEVILDGIFGAAR